MAILPSHLSFLGEFTHDDFYSNANLHIHSNCSDGKMSPKEILEQAQQLHLHTIAIMDHNTTQAYKDLENSCDLINSSVKLLTGIEFDTWHKGHFMHILGYGIQPFHPKILELQAKNTWETRVDLIRLTNFQRTASRVISAIRESNGIAVLAHPCCILAWNFEKLLQELISLGLVGIEVYYPYIKHRRFLKFRSIDFIQKLAKKYQLVITGGTDCHKSKLNRLKDFI